MTNRLLGVRRLFISLRCACLWTVLVLGSGAIGCQSVPNMRGQSPEITRPIGVESSEANIKDLIEDILVEGNNTIDTGAVLAHIKSQRGRPADERQIKEDLRALYGTNWFYTVERRYRMTENGLMLVFKVVEKPVVKSVQISGNDAIRTKTLLKQINIEAGSPYDVSINKAAARNIERFYRDKKSFPFAEVALTTGDDPNDRDVIFEVKEGQRVIVDDIEFIGNDSFSDAILKTKIKTKTAFLDMTLFGGKYDESTIPDDLQAVKDYYNSLGHFDVTVEKSIDIKDNWFHIVPQNRYLPRVDAKATYVYTINEGVRYQVRNVILDGNEIFTEADLRDGEQLKDGDMFNARFLNKDVERMKTMYGKLGRLYSKVEPMPKFLKEKPGIVDLVYHIDEDRPYTIRDIDVHIHAPGGVPHTREPVVLNPLLFAPGDLADPFLIAKSKGRLRGQIFENGGPNGPRIDVSRVEEKKAPKKGSGNKVVRGQSPESGSRHETSDGVEQAVHQLLPPDMSVEELFRTDDSSDFVVRGQNPLNAQPVAPNLLFENSNAGDPYKGLQSPYARALEAAPGEVDVDVDVTEAQTGRLMFGVGVNSNAGVIGQFTLEENNFDITRVPTSWRDIVEGSAFRGNGEKFRIEAMPGQIVSRYMVSWQNPYFLDTDYSFGVSGFYYNRFLPGWNEQRAGGRISVGKQIDKWWSVTGALRLEDVQIDNFSLTDANLTPVMRRVKGSNLLSTARLSVAHDTRDSSFLPT